MDLLRNCGLSAALFLVFTPGFAVQYLIYLIPWLAVAGSSTAAVFSVLSGAFAFAFYTWGAGGVPWYLADFFATRFIPVHVFVLSLLTWVATAIVAWNFLADAINLNSSPLSGISRRIRADDNEIPDNAR